MVPLFDTIESAAQYLGSIWSDFQNKGEEIRALQRQALIDADAARAAGDDQAFNNYRQNARDLLDALENWTNLYSQALPYAVQIGLSVWPTAAIVIGSVIGTAVAIYAFYQAYNSLVGNLSPAGYNSNNSGLLPNLTNTFSSATGLIVVGVLAYFLVRKKI